MSAPTAGLVVRRSAGADVISLSGEVDVAASPELALAAVDGIGGGPGVAVDLTRVTYFDSGGVRMMDRLVRECRARSLAVRVVAPAGGAARIVLEVCAFPADLLAESLAEALAGLRGD